jgi:4-azaleucine resistance transporter AzlC
MRKVEFGRGFLAVLPLLLGVFPFGMIYGVLALQAGIERAPAQAMSAILFAGSSQFIAAQLYGSGTPAVVIVLTAFVVNLRHALYGASLAPFIQHLSAPWKGVLAYLLTDEAYAAVITRYTQQGVQPLTHWFFLGAGLGLWSCWQISTALGIFLGAQIPAAWGLDFTLALTFIALVVPALKDRPAVAAAVTGGLAAVIFYPLPYKLGLIAAALCGIGAGLWSEMKWQRSG